MNFIPLSVDEKLREVTRHGSREFPVAVYLRRMNRKEEGYLILHWHDELQFVVPRRGPLSFTAGEQTYVLNEGQCLFINSRVLHTAKPLDTVGGDYVCIDFHPSLLYSANSLISRKYVQPYLTSQSLASLLIDGQKSWHAEAKSLLETLIAAYDAADYGCELEVLNLLQRLWLLIVCNNREQTATEVILGPYEQARLDRIIAYIQKNYAEKMTLADIASAALLSASECCRFVKRTLGLAPMQYLNQYRIVQSTELLRTTSRSVSEIAFDVGFNSASYYTERFKEMMNCRPLEYRKMYLAAQNEEP